MFVVQGKSLKEQVYRVIYSKDTKIKKVITDYTFEDKQILKDICCRLNENNPEEAVKDKDIGSIIEMGYKDLLKDK